MNQLSLYLCPLSFGFPSHLGHYRALRRVLCAIRRFSLVIYFIHSINSVYMSPQNSQLILAPSHPLGIHVFVCVCVPSCFSRARLFATLWTISATLGCLRASPGENTGVGCHFLLWGIFLTQGSKLDLLHRGQILYHPSHQGSYTVGFSLVILYIVSIVYICLSQSPRVW